MCNAVRRRRYISSQMRYPLKNLLHESKVPTTRLTEKNKITTKASRLMNTPHMIEF